MHKTWPVTGKISVVHTNGEQRIVIEIGAKRGLRQPIAFPLSEHRQAIANDLDSLTRPTMVARRTAKIRRHSQRRSLRLMTATLRLMRVHKGDKHLAAHALGITRDRLIERLGHYRRRGWIRRNGKAWVRVKHG